MFLTLCLDDARVEITRRFYERLGCNFTLSNMAIAVCRITRPL